MTTYVTSHHSLITTYCSLLTVHYSLPTAHYSLVTDHYSLLTTRCLLLTTHHLLLTTHYLMLHCRTAASVDADMVVFLTARPIGGSDGMTETIAFAGHCERDQFGR